MPFFYTGKCHTPQKAEKPCPKTAVIFYIPKRYNNFIMNRKESEPMTRTIGIGVQDFGKLWAKNNFHVDKTGFIKGNAFKEARKNICRITEEQYNKKEYLLKGDLLNEKEKGFYQEVSAAMPDTAAVALRMKC
ncbi:MAG TPA: hypothetical protein DF613_05875 [Lachnospiraceae bacterium]|nr:hypothetical protein [Lachnospiraceae bacterium]